MTSPDDLDPRSSADAAIQRLRALRAAGSTSEVRPLDGIADELLRWGRAKLAKGDALGAAKVLDALLDAVPADHPQREELAALAARARASQPDALERTRAQPSESVRRSGTRVSLDDMEKKGFRSVKVLRAGEINALILEAVQLALAKGRVALSEDEQGRLVAETRRELDREMALAREAGRVEETDDTPELAERLVDPALSAGYLLMAAQDGELTPMETASLEDRLGAADPVLRVEWAWLERTRAALGRVATLVPADEDVVWDRLRAGVRARLDLQAAKPHASTPHDAKLNEERQQVDQAHRSLETKLAEVNRQFAAEKQAFLREKQAFLRETQALVEGLTPRRAGPRVVRCGSIEAASVHVAAAGEPNGDLVDLVDRGTGVDVLIADVSGRGAVALAAAMATRAGVHSALAAGAEPTAALAATNRALKHVLSPTTFVGAALVRWDEARGRAVIAGAGHEDAIVYRAGTRRAERMRLGGVVLGVVDNPPAFAPREVELAPGDVLLLVSDGATDEPGLDGEAFCDPAWTRLLGLVAAQGHLDATALVGAVRDKVQVWGGAAGTTAPKDDVVVVALRRTSPPPLDAKVATVVSMLGLDAFFRP